MTRAAAAMSAGAAVALVLCAPAGVAAAQSPLPIGNDRGVVVRADAPGVVVSFRRAAARRFAVVAGRRVRVRCVNLPPPRLGIRVTEARSETLRAPRRRRPFRAVSVSGRGVDFCEVFRASFDRKRRGVTQRVPARLVASVPLTSRGAVYLDERELAGELSAVVTGVGTLADERRQSTFPTSQEIQARSRGQIVALADPGGTPPKGKLGYYSDGALHVAVVAVSAVGRRLFIELDGDRLATNVAEYLNE